jgi:pyrroloquinoline-quinone synthase
MPDRDHRRQWITRILDHDGTQGDEGGIHAWLTLGEAVGLTREEVSSQRHVLPGVRFAVDAYINFARRAPWQEAVCSSLTELFAPEIHKERLANWPQHYPWIDQSGYAYFRKRLSEARRDVEHGLRVSLEYFQTRAQQERALENSAVQARHTVVDARCHADRLRNRSRARRRRHPNAENERIEHHAGSASSSCGGNTAFSTSPHRNLRTAVPGRLDQAAGRLGEIMKRVDGKTSVEGIVQDLQNTFPGVELRQDVIDFLEVAYGKGWIRTK